MLPTSPRADTRSMCSSCTMLCSSTATRVSCGVTLMRISLAIGGSEHGKADPRQDLGGLEQRQAHHARIAAVEMLHKRGSLALDCVTAGLVERFTGRNVALDFIFRNHAKGDARARDGLHEVLTAVAIRWQAQLV